MIKRTKKEYLASENKLVENTRDEVLDAIGKYHAKYFDLVWYARKPLYEDVDTAYKNSPEDIREGCKNTIAKVEEHHPNDVNALMRDETNWTHGFNSGCLAAFRFCERALNPSMELDDYFLEELLDEDVFETDTPIEEAEEMFPELDT